MESLMSAETEPKVSRGAIPAPPSGSNDHDEDTERVTVVVPGDRTKGETGRLVTGTPLQGPPDKRAPVKPHTDRIRGHEVQVHVKHRGEYKWFTTVNGRPTDDELRDLIPELRHRGGRVKLTDELGNKESFPVPGLHPVALARLGYQDTDEDGFADGVTIGPGFTFPPQMFERPAPIDWPALLTAAAPLVGSFMTLFVEAIRRPPPPPPPPPSASTGNSLKEAIEALVALQTLSADLRPEPAEADGMGGLVQTILGALRPPQSLPGGPIPFQMPPHVAQPSYGPPTQPTTGNPAQHPSPPPPIPTVVRDVAVHRAAAARAAAAKQAGAGGPNIPTPTGPLGPPRPTDLENDPAELAAKHRLSELARACSMSLEEATHYLHGYTDGRWTSMLAAAEAGLQNLASMYAGDAQTEGDDDEDTDSDGPAT